MRIMKNTQLHFGEVNISDIDLSARPERLNLIWTKIIRSIRKAISCVFLSTRQY